MDSWGSQDILAGFEPADPRSNRGESVNIYQSGKKGLDFRYKIKKKNFRL